MRTLLTHLTIFAAAAAALPFALGQYGLYMGCALCVWAAFALAYDLAFGRTGLVSFGHAMFFGIGGYAFVLAILHGGFSFWPALLLALVITALFSIAVGFIALRVTGHAFVIITVIFGAIVELAAASAHSVTRGEDGLTFTMPQMRLGPIAVSLADPVSRYLAFLAAFLAVYLICWWIGRSSLGLVLDGIRQNERRVAMLGYRVSLYKMIAFTLSGTLSGFAGVFFSILNFHISAEVFHIAVSMNPLTAALVGGAGTVLGPVIGAVIVFALSDLLRSVIVYSDLVIGIVLIVIVLVAPRGLGGLWISRRKAEAAPSFEARTSAVSAAAGAKGPEVAS
jgi:branched-chain amino acid transport system permease protein